MDNKKVLSIYVCILFNFSRHTPSCIYKIWIKPWLASCLRKQYILFRVSRAQLRVKIQMLKSHLKAFCTLLSFYSIPPHDSMSWKGVLILAINKMELFWCKEIWKRMNVQQSSKVPIICISSAKNLQYWLTLVWKLKALPKA